MPIDLAEYPAIGDAPIKDKPRIPAPPSTPRLSQSKKRALEKSQSPSSSPPDKKNANDVTMSVEIDREARSRASSFGSPSPPVRPLTPLLVDNPPPPSQAKSHKIVSPEAHKAFDQAQICSREFDTLKEKSQNGGLQPCDYLNLIGLLVTSVNAMAEATMSLDKKYGDICHDLPPKTAKLVSNTSIQVIQNRRSDSLRESAKSLKLPSVPFSKTQKDGQVDNKEIAEKAKTIAHAAKELMGKVQIRPLRRFPREGNTSVPVLVTFNSASQCADAERALRSDKVSVAPNYSSEVFGLIKKMRYCIEKKYPDHQILIRPSQSFLNFNIKIRTPGNKWEFLTSVPMPLTPEEMRRCGISKNPCNNNYVQI